MRQKSYLWLMVLLATSLITANIPFKTYSSTETRIYLEPSNIIYYTNTTSIGYLFNVTVICENVPDLGGAQIYMEFNDSIINVTRWWYVPESEGGFMPEPVTTLPSPPNPGYFHLAPGRGRIQIAVSKGGLPPQAPWGHNGKIAIIEFNVTAVPTEGALTTALIINSADTYLLDQYAAEIPNVHKEDGTYALIYAPTPTVPSIWLEASPRTFVATKPGRPFNVSVIIQNVSESDCLIGVQFEVRYNATYLKATEIYPGDFLNNSLWAPYGTVSTYYIDDYIPGRVVYGEIILPNETGYWNPPFPAGNGIMAIITFMPLLNETVSLNITIEPLFGEFFLNKDGEYLPYYPAIGCQYEYTPIYIPAPTLAVEPTIYISSSLGENFEINVTINELDERWELIYVEFKLGFDGTLLEILSATEGPFLAQFGNTAFNYEKETDFVKVNITLTITNGAPHGGGTLATLLFNVTSRPPANCSLQLYDITLKYVGGYELPSNMEHGYYVMHERLVHEVIADTSSFYIVTVSDGAISPVKLDVAHRLLNFNITGNEGTSGFINITIPNNLLWAEENGWLVIVGGEEVVVTVTAINATHTMLSFNVSFSTKSVYIIGTGVIPEFSLPVLLILLSTITLSITTIKLHSKRKKL